MLLCFSLVGHEQKVGHETFAHGLWLKDYVMLVDIVLLQIIDCFMAVVKFGFEQRKNYYR